MGSCAAKIALATGMLVAAGAATRCSSGSCRLWSHCGRGSPGAGHHQLVLLHHCRQLALYDADTDTWQALLTADADTRPEPGLADRLATATPVKVDGEIRLVGADLPHTPGAIIRIR